MKLDGRGTEVTTSGSHQQKKFHVLEGARAFRVLSSTLYSDKPRAVIRELSCNAWDAHIAAGKPNEPFELHIPTVHEPWLAVKDCGTGLFHEDVMDLFCTYFGSNKDKSNKFIGALGLGSKSPFCYTDAYTIRVTYYGDGHCPECDEIVAIDGGEKHQVMMRHDRDGHTYGENEKAENICDGTGKPPAKLRERMTRLYDAFIGEDSEPVLQLTAEASTPDAPIGIEVKFAVKQNDVWEFENKAKKALEFFTPMPKTNVEGFDINQTKYTIRSDRWGMRETVQTDQGNGPRAIMGNVPYSIGGLDMSRLNASTRRVVDLPIDIFFNIGDLSFAASRETLELNDKTVKKLMVAYEEIYDSFLKAIKERIDLCQQAWEARLLVFSLTSAPGMGGIVNDAWNTGKLFGRYKNFDLEGKQPKLNTLDWTLTTVVVFKHNKKAAVNAKKSYLFAQQDADSTGVAQFERTIDTEQKAHFVLNNLEKGGDKYIHYFIQQAAAREQHGKQIVYVFTRRSDEIALPAMAHEAGKMLAAIGNPKFELLSDLKARYAPMVDKERERRQYERTGRRKIVVLKSDIWRGRYGDMGWSKAWAKSEQQPDGTKYYVALTRLKAIESGYEDAFALIKFIKTVRASGAFGLSADTPVYGLRENSKLRKKPEWVELIGHVFKTVYQIMTPEKELQLALLLKPFQVGSTYDDLLKHIAKEKPLAEDSPMQQFAVSFAQARAHRGLTNDSFKTVLDEATKRGYYKQGHVPDFDRAWDGAKSHYPLLSMGSFNSSNKRFQTAILEYLKFVDEARKIKAAEENAMAAAAGEEGRGKL